MANPEHLEILRQGVEVWNSWRKEKPEIKPDLSNLALPNTDFHGIDFGKVNLRMGNLYGVNISGANLCNANLSLVRFGGANISNSNLTGADLQVADLRGTNLNNANLTSVNFSACNFDGANVKTANFKNAIFRYTAFINIDLCCAYNLESIIHEGPSSIGIDTLYKSKGNIPEVFLRGCGVPDQMIEYAKSLTANPIDYYSCFISYSHKDEEFAKRLWEGLQANNVRCWFAPHDLKIGDKIRSVIDETIRVHDKLLLILSEHSVQSDWVEHEVEHALELEKERKKGMLFPVQVDDAIMDSKTGWAGNVKRQRHIGDFTLWKDHDAYKAAFDRLLRDLKAG
ncbi:MAG: toll/interleukin-1 receptor domain-containing protein [Chlorobiaceae bacterium]|jgi:uncharacterized protein YjbI with pentapeptide repeats|nr:toll/interleukin-1 receptor domain-containing protein [Chlorobiaceae bacterium]